MTAITSKAEGAPLDAALALSFTVIGAIGA